MRVRRRAAGDGLSPLTHVGRDPLDVGARRDAGREQFRLRRCQRLGKAQELRARADRVATGGTRQQGQFAAQHRVRLNVSHQPLPAHAFAADRGSIGRRAGRARPSPLARHLDVTRGIAQLHDQAIDACAPQQTKWLAPS